jgi:hypothetical protein
MRSFSFFLVALEWLDFPLEAYLEDVPENKLWVHTNYRSALTGNLSLYQSINKIWSYILFWNGK